MQLSPWRSPHRPPTAVRDSSGSLPARRRCPATPLQGRLPEAVCAALMYGEPQPSEARCPYKVRPGLDH